MKLFTKSRDGLYEATAEYEDGTVTVEKGSKINRRNSKGFFPSENIQKLRNDAQLFDHDILTQNVKFDTLSSAATFVTGRIANGMIVWKTADGRYVRCTLQQGDGK